MLRYNGGIVRSKNSNFVYYTLLFFNYIIDPFLTMGFNLSNCVFINAFISLCYKFITV